MIEKKICCKNVVIFMFEFVVELVLNGLCFNLCIVFIVMFNFVSYLIIGLLFVVLFGYVYDVMGFSVFWVGFIISL